MPDTSSAAYRGRADRYRRQTVEQDGPLLVSGIEPIDGTWFETVEDPPVDEPLLLFIPLQRDH